MQEITQNILIDNSYPGVTLGAINAPHGLILIDSPLRQDDIRSWRSALLNHSGGVDRILINLDAHPDRTLGARSMDCTIVGHEDMAFVFRNRPTTFKAQNAETGSEWEQLPNLGVIRWSPPEISFTDELHIFWGTNPIHLEHRPGSATGAIWIHIPEEKVIFIGDFVVKDQPPFISHADIPMWIQNLESLLTLQFREYFLISGRNGLIAYEDVRRQLNFLQMVQPIVTKLTNGKNNSELIENSIPELLGAFSFPPEKTLQYTQRLRYGLTHIHSRENRIPIIEIDE